MTIIHEHETLIANNEIMSDKFVVKSFNTLNEAMGLLQMEILKRSKFLSEECKCEEIETGSSKFTFTITAKRGNILMHIAYSIVTVKDK